MGIEYLFYLNDVEYEEPIGFDALELSVKRDDLTHGVTFEVSTGVLTFHGAAAIYLKEQKEIYGIKAYVIFEAFTRCDGYDYKLLCRGKLNFGKYKAACGSSCKVSIPVEQDDCQLTLKSRYDQKVDLDKNTSQDGFTVLPSYAGLRMPTNMPAVELEAAAKANVAEDGYDIDLIIGIEEDASQRIGFRPLYPVKQMDNINTSNLDTGNDYALDPDAISSPQALSPQVLFDERPNCFSGSFNYSVRMKGNLEIVELFNDVIIDSIKLKVDKGIWADEMVNVETVSLPTSFIQSFDETLEGIVTLSEGDGFYGYLEIIAHPFDHTCSVQFIIHFDTESRIDLVTSKICVNSEVEAYLIHETLSRVAESITNRCVRVKSEYYGRTDSEPFEFAADGCGGVRFLTSGLKLRLAPEDKFFASLKDLFEGLNAIDNIGMGFEVDEAIPNALLLRIENVNFFYKNYEILRCPFIPELNEVIDERKHYSKIEVGYAKWEIQDINGLREINSNREYATNFDTLSNTLDIKSKLITGSYPIEITRQQSFAETGAADTSYDNEIFLVCMFRGGYLYGELMVEQGNVLDPVNIPNSSTILNYRLSPVRNLMRWFKSIMAGFKNLSDAKLFFNAGTGNITAGGEQSSGFCKIEADDLLENQNITRAHFASETAYTPIWAPEILTYEYPLSLAEYNAIKANPYGYVSYQCGQGEYQQGWLKEIKYKPAKGMATIILIKRWQLV